jgi:hypothetical protein
MSSKGRFSLERSLLFNLPFKNQWLFNYLFVNIMFIN